MKTKQLTLNAMLLALLIILGMTPPLAIGLPVPIVLQNVAIFLIVGLTNTRSALLIIGTFLTLAALGLPILSGMRGGLPVLLGPTGGYLLGWLLTPIGVWAVRRWSPQPFWSLLIGGMLLTDVIGTVWLAAIYHTPWLVAATSNLAFIPGDVLKVIVSTYVIIGVNRAVSFK